MKGIGNTPLIKLEKLTGPSSAEIYIKYEGTNMTGSMKDRMAFSMIEGAERKGLLRKGMKVVEYTGGSTFPGRRHFRMDYIGGKRMGGFAAGKGAGGGEKNRNSDHRFRPEIPPG
jgi:hypothetical protein